MDKNKTDDPEHADPAHDDAKNEGEDEEDDEVFETNWDQSVESFDDLGLKEEVLRGVYGYGFEKPS